MDGLFLSFPLFPATPDQAKIAVVHDWLDTWRGGENVLAEIIDLYPHADLFALVDWLPDSARAALHGKRAQTTLLQRLPQGRRYYRALLPLFPRAIESLDVSAYDLVISVSHAVAKGIRTHPRQVHVCYCSTPMRYAWDLRPAYVETVPVLLRPLLDRVLDRLQRWDRATARHVDRFLANSEFVRKRIRRFYRRDATVVHPPVDVDYFTPRFEPGEDKPYVTASRWVPYKRIDLVVAAFALLPDRRLVVAGAGPDAARIRRAAGSNVTLVGELPRDDLRTLLRSARAFVFAAEEDFGILPVEAQACGIPVIAYGRGGACETVRGNAEERPTGVFFCQQSARAIADAIRTFEALPVISPQDCRAQAELFARERFRHAFRTELDRAWRYRTERR